MGVGYRDRYVGRFLGGIFIVVGLVGRIFIMNLIKLRVN